MDIKRAALIDQLRNYRRCVVVAGTGFGKSVLASQLVQTGGRLLSAGDDFDLDSHQLHIIDDVHRLSDEDLARVIAAFDRSPETPVVMLGRAVPAELSERCDLQLGSQDLRFSHSEIEELLVQVGNQCDAQAIGLISDLSCGWPRAVHGFAVELGLEQTRGDGALARLARRATPRTALLAPLAQALGDHLPLARTLAMFEFFDREILSLLGFDPELVVQQMALAGLPAEEHFGWLRFADIFSALLLEEPQPPVPAKALHVAMHFHERDETVAGIDACVALGERGAAAELIAQLTYANAVVDVDELNQRMVLLGDAVDHHPRSLLVQWWANLDVMNLTVGLPALRRCENAVRLQVPRDGTLWAEVMLELAYQAYIDAEPELAQALIDESGAADGAFAETPMHARMLEVQAGVLSLSREAPALMEARAMLIQADSYWRREGHLARSVAASMRLALHVLEPAGLLNEALGTVDGLRSRTGLSPVDAARVEVLRARLLARLGRQAEMEEAAVKAHEAAVLLDLGWIVGFVEWARVIAADHEINEDVLARRVEDAESALGDLLTRDTGLLFLCDAASAWARIGNSANAQSCLDRAATIDGSSADLALARLHAEAHVGDPHEAEDHAVGLAERLEPGRRWQIVAALGTAAARRGDETAMEQHIAAASSAAAEIGLDDLAEAAAVVARRHVETEPGGAVLPGRNDTVPGSAVFVRLFDGFEVSVDGNPIPTPVGHAATIVKLAIVNRGVVKVDQAVDALWPDADLATGRQRLRNVLGRLRKAVGADLIGRSGDSLVLSASVQSDLGQALSLSDGALRTSMDSVDVAVAALAAMPEPERLLLEDRYDDWAIEACAGYRTLRERVSEHHARLTATSTEPGSERRP